MDKDFLETLEKRKVSRSIYLVFKRIIDFLVALIGLIVAFPFMLLIAMAIKASSKGPVLFTQMRSGKNGKPFKLYKFRTMVKDNDVHDFSKQDQHTKIGKILRKTSLDELPQLINVIKGDISIIGPRPWITDYYDAMNDYERHRYDCLPGITGLAQAMGRNNLTIFDKINYDIDYVKNVSLFMDIKIIFLTVKAVFTQCGADAGKSTISNELEALKKENGKSSKKSVKKRKK